MRFGIGTDRNIAPNIMQFNTIPAIINIAPRHVYDVTNSSVNGANINVPKPEPHTAIPVANDRYFSNHIVTLTMAGK